MAEGFKMVVVNGIRYRPEDAPEGDDPKAPEPAPAKKRPVSANKKRTPAATKADKPTDGDS